MATRRNERGGTEVMITILGQDNHIDLGEIAMVCRHFNSEVVSVLRARQPHMQLTEAVVTAVSLNKVHESLVMEVLLRQGER
ncbi:uncharacterized protein BDW43DRAFT_289941 [Aspergillus alliaceus]|uniref:uncharacterized protein n=1 Tax=Petromyces alliaceus TaxID=209559 RepID=UPI0012A62E3A|nr:uncharacterized protein BDW43DRAFT_289941 [Aspergillus alliaceus]KAB8228767.1 hypothetical protein BDW43DRAFT_289941 [Aspergillus alliaceus]